MPAIGFKSIAEWMNKHLKDIEEKFGKISPLDKPREVKGEGMYA